MNLFTKLAKLKIKFKYGFEPYRSIPEKEPIEGMMVPRAIPI
jgi:hypothetical protein